MAAQEITTPRSQAIEDYAKAIYALSRRLDGPVGTSELAGRLGVAPASATVEAASPRGTGTLYLARIDLAWYS